MDADEALGAVHRAPEQVPGGAPAHPAMNPRTITIAYRPRRLEWISLKMFGGASAVGAHTRRRTIHDNVASALERNDRVIGAFIP